MLTTNSEKDFHELTKNYQFYITTYILEINPIANACEKTLIVEVPETTHGYRDMGIIFKST